MGSLNMGVEGNQIVSYQEYGPYDVDEQGPGTDEGVNWAEKHGLAIVDRPPDVELHRPSDVNWTDNVVHAKVNKEAGNKDTGKQADDIAAETCVDPIKIWDSLNVPNRPHEECAPRSNLKDVSDELNSLEGSDDEEGEQGPV
ncbi:hypothetical protein LWI28_002607 [Acer negundo]|uniref:Uncharacterized protein n=1 Tax=Acer negundo TaxID=4023 RepID=A0AAD5J3L6_ACENE|nr:hypothetical protein LWI28_002607 [Acer negundo]